MLRTVIMFCLFAIPAALLASKQDTVYFKNGDRITGEIKSMDVGKMQFKTDEMKTVNIDWDDIKTFNSPSHFNVTKDDRTMVFCRFGFADSAGAVNLLMDDGSSEPIILDDIVAIGKVKDGFWEKIDGRLDAGLNYTKASEVLSYNFGGRISFKNKRWVFALSGQNITTEQSERPTQVNQNAGAEINYKFIRRWYVVGAQRWERNTGLDLDSRWSTGAGIGNDFVYTAVHRLYGIAGVNMNLERAIDSATVQQSAEGAVSLGYLLYNSGFKDFYMDVNVTIYPGITIPERTRGRVDIAPKVEVISDLKLGLEYYYLFDTQPLTETAAREDFGILASLYYTF
jgi:hypothetical protein